MPHTVTIDAALEAFLDAEAQRLSAGTMRNYRDVVGLLRDAMNG